MQDVLHKHKKLACASQVGTLAVKLAKQAYFGEMVMVQCIVAGDRGSPGLPTAELQQLKTTFSVLPRILRRDRGTGRLAGQRGWVWEGDVPPPAEGENFLGILTVNAPKISS